MVKCPECGREVEPSYVYCPYCYPQYQGYKRPTEDAKKKLISLPEGKSIKDISGLFKKTNEILFRNLIIIFPLMPLFAPLLMFYSFIFNLLLDPLETSFLVSDIISFISFLVSSSVPILFISAIILAFSYSFFPVFTLQYASEKRINIMQSFPGVGKRLIPSFILGLIIFMLTPITFLVLSFILPIISSLVSFLLVLLISLLVLGIIQTMLLFSVPSCFFDNTNIPSSIKNSIFFFLRNKKSILVLWPLFILNIIVFVIPIINIIMITSFLLSSNIIYFYAPVKKDEKQKEQALLLVEKFSAGKVRK